MTSLPAGINVRAVVAAEDGLLEYDPAAEGSGIRQMREFLRALRCVGGQDATQLLARASEIAAQKPGSVVLWVHGPQPVTIGDTRALVARLDADRAKVRIIELQAQPGINRVLDAIIDGNIAVDPAVATGELGDDMRAVCAGFAPGLTRFRFIRTAVSHAPAADAHVKQTDLQLARLWAKDQVMRVLSEDPTDDKRTAAAKLACLHQLVTPVSGAVVLETQRDYDANGLSPAQVVPLPSALVMVLLAVPILWILMRKKSSLLSPVLRGELALPFCHRL
jgi:hypothetical protein